MEFADELRIGIVGCGMIALEHIRNIGVLQRRSGGLSIDVLCDCSEAALDAAEGECEAEELESERRRYTSLDAMLEEEKDSLDCVILCTPNYQHHSQLQLIIRATWWAVLAEKPLCTTVADALSVVNEDASRMARWQGGAGSSSSQRTRHGDSFLPIVWVAMEYRYMAPVSEVLKRVQRGDLGKVWHCTVKEHRFPFLPKAAEWNKHAINTGQTIVEKSCHYLDLIRQFKRGVRPVRVACLAGMDVNFMGEQFNGKPCDIWDAAMLLIEFEDGSRAFHELCMYAEGTEEQEQIEVVGSKGKASVRIPEAVVKVGSREGGSDGIERTKIEVDEEALAAGTHFGSVYFEIVRFCQAVRGKRSVEVTTEDGAWAVALGVAATLAAQDRRVIDVDAVLPRGVLPSERGGTGAGAGGKSTGEGEGGQGPVDYTPAGSRLEASAAECATGRSFAVCAPATSSAAASSSAGCGASGASGSFVASRCLGRERIANPDASVLLAATAARTKVLRYRISPSACAGITVQPRDVLGEEYVSTSCLAGMAGRAKL